MHNLHKFWLEEFVYIKFYVSSKSRLRFRCLLTCMNIIKDDECDWSLSLFWWKVKELRQTRLCWVVYNKSWKNIILVAKALNVIEFSYSFCIGWRKEKRRRNYWAWRTPRQNWSFEPGTRFTWEGVVCASEKWFNWFLWTVPVWSCTQRKRQW